jgi:hypothetical protein
MGLLFLLASYVTLYHAGQLLMRLVVVQPVGDDSVERWCFASTFALSLSLFSAVLADMAHASFFTISVAGSSSGLSLKLRRLQSFVAVDAREFTFLLLCLLATVLLACPCVITASFLRHLFSRGKRSGGGARSGAGKHGKRSRRSSSVMAGASAGDHSSGSRRHSFKGFNSGGRSSSSNGSGGFAFDEDRRQCGRCSRRSMFFAAVLLCLVAGGCWASRTGRLDVGKSGQRVVHAGKEVYQHLQTRSALFKVPREIQPNSRAENTVGETAGGEGVADGTPILTFTAALQRDNIGKGEWGFDFAAVSAAFAPLDLYGVVRAVTSRVAVVGVAMIGLLAGYAAITSPCLYLAPYTHYRGREAELRRAQSNFTKKLCYVLGNYGNAQRQIAALQYGVLHEEWSSPAFSGSTPSSNTHNVPPSFGLPPASCTTGVDANRLYGTPDSVDLSAAAPSPLQQPEQQEQQHQFVESSPPSAKQYPPPPRRPGSNKPLDAAALASTSTSSSGAVGWLQRKLASAATVVASGITGRGRDSPSTPTSAVMSPAMFRQRAVTRITKLRDESKGSRFLSLSLYLQLNEVEGMLRDAQRGETWVGRWYACLGAAMAVYSAIKIALTAASLWYFKASTQDPVTRAVTLLENAFILRRRHHTPGSSFSVTAVEVSTHVILGLALLVNGWMVLSSIRGALLALFHVTMSFSGSAISRPETVAVGLSMMIGGYFVGQLVLLRASLPKSAAWQSNAVDGLAGAADGEANVLLQALGTLPYYYYQRLNDWCFLVGCLGAVVVRRFVLRDALSSVVNTASGGEER